MRHRTITKSLSPMLSQTLMGTRVPDLLDMFGPQSGTLNTVFTTWEFQPFPGDFDDTCLFVGPTPTRSLPDATFPLDRLRDHNGTVVYATLGTVYNRWTPFFRAVIDAAVREATTSVLADDAGRAAMTQLQDSFRTAGGSKAAVRAINAILACRQLGSTL